MNARGVVFVHSSPTAVCPHVEWAISGVLGTKVSLPWTPQPAVHGQMRAECSWTGPAGSGGALAGALRAWSMLRFEVTEEPSPGVDGERFCHVPTLGLWRGTTSANGDIVIGEDRLRALLAEAPAAQLPAAAARAARLGLGRGAGALPAGPATAPRSPGCTGSAKLTPAHGSAAGEGDRGVVAAEAERVADRGGQVHLAGLAGHHVELDARDPGSPGSASPG